MAFVFAINSYAQTIENDSTSVTELEMVKISKKNITSDSKKINVTYSHLLNHDAGSFLKTIPEISGIKKAGNFATDPVLRGFKYEQLNVVIDGAANAINACPSRMDPAISQVNMNMIQDAEIYKGPYNFRYGTALGGTINFTTIQPKFTEKIQLKNRFSTGFESNGKIFRNELLSELSSKKMVWIFFGSYQKGNRYKDGNQNEVPSAFLRYNVGTKGTIKWNDTNFTTLQVNTNQGRDVEFAALKMDLIYDKTWMFQLKHLTMFNHSILKQIEFNSYLSTVHHSMGTPDKSMISNVKSSTFGGRMESKFNWKKNYLFSGLDFKHEEAKNVSAKMSSMMMNKNGSSWQDSEINQIGWFTEFTHQFHQAKFIASYRLDFNQANANEMSPLFETLYGKMKSNYINNSISFGYKQHLNSKNDVSIWIGRGQRSPSLTERYINRFVVGTDAYEVVGNPLLKAEINNQADLIYTYKNDKLFIQSNLFYSYLENYISGVIRDDIKPNSMHSPGVRQMQNIKKAYKTGIESRVNWQFLERFNTDIAFAYTYAENLVDKIPLPEIAPFNLKWKVEADFSPFNFGISYHYSSKQNRIAQDFGELKTPQFSVFNIDTNYTLTKNIFINFEISNLFDKAYSEHLNRTYSDNTKQRILERGRSFNLNINMKF